MLLTQSSLSKTYISATTSALIPHGQQLVLDSGLRGKRLATKLNHSTALLNNTNNQLDATITVY